MKIYHLQVEISDRGRRLDAFLAERLRFLSRSALQGIIRAGGVRDRGASRADRGATRADRADQATALAKASHRLRGAERIEVRLDSIAQEGFVLEDREVICCDSALLAISKRPGEPTYSRADSPGGGHWAAAQRWLAAREPASQTLPELGPCHRLDKGTTGVLLFSRSAAAGRAIFEAFCRGAVQKTYWAVLEGEVSQDLISESGARLISRLRPKESGRPGLALPGEPWVEAVTDCRVLVRRGGKSLVEAHPLTGRTQQLRIQFAEIGHPIEGDALRCTNPSDAAGERLMLHALRLKLPHPLTGEPLALESTPPADWSLCP